MVLTPARAGSGLRQGERVVGLADGGSWAERVAVPSHRIAPLPDSVSLADAAALPVAGLTALRALRTGGSLVGRRALITGASGGVGSFAVQLAVAAGAHVTALVSGEHRLELVRELGAHRATTRLDDGPPFDLVLDGVGGPVLAGAIHHLAPEGTVAAYGMAGGGQCTPLSFADFGSAPFGRLVGVFVYAHDDESMARDLAALAGLVADGRLRVAAHPRPWDQTVEAVEELRGRVSSGKQVLTLEPQG